MSIWEINNAIYILKQKMENISLKKNKKQDKRKYLRTMQQTQQKAQTNHQIKSQVYSLFLAYLNKRRVKFLKEKLIDYYGKNFPINYKKSYGFQQQWTKVLANQSTTESDFTYQQKQWQLVLNFLTIIVYVIIIWASNIYFFFGRQQKFRWQIYIAGLGLQIINGINALFKQLKFPSKGDKFQDFKRFAVSQFITIPYLLVKLTDIEGLQLSAFSLYEISVWVILYFKASKLYNSIRLMSFCLYYQYQTKLFDMLITIFIIAHFISIILYSVSLLNKDTNWHSNLNINENNSIELYIYSFYFCMTTILTVGYGDICPKNPWEVIVVTLIEVFGIIMFGYMINEIGYCISSLRKSRQIIEKDLFVVQKMKNHYKIGKKLTQKMRSYLMNVKPKLQQVLPEEQNGILIKLNEEIRADVIKQSSLSIVKSSIFFVCRWTKKFQNSVAANLVHIMVKPNDILYESKGKQRIYIICSGKIHIFAARIGSSHEGNSVIKSIENSIKNQITNNCYGFSSVISMRPSKLYAVSKEFTSCYYIEKPQFLECVKSRIQDFEYFHEIKSKMDSSKFQQIFEVPRLDSSKFFYNPTKSYVLRKYLKDKIFKNKRKTMLRHQRSSFRGTKHIYNEQISNHVAHLYLASHETNFYEPTEKETQSERNNIIPPYDQMDFANLEDEQKLAKYLSHYFESSREYSNYFVHQNQSEILRRYDNSFYFPNNDKNLNSMFTNELYKQARQKDIINNSKGVSIEIKEASAKVNNQNKRIKNSGLISLSKY